MFFKNVLIATDGSKQAEKAAEYAVGVAQSCDAQLHVLSVVDVGKPRQAYEIDQDYAEEIGDNQGVDLEALEEERKKPEQQFVNRINELASAEGVNATTAVTVGKPADEILSYASANGCDLIVVGSHGRRPLTAALLGSTASSLVHAGTVPVLVVPANER